MNSSISRIALVLACLSTGLGQRDELDHKRRRPASNEDVQIDLAMLLLAFNTAPARHSRSAPSVSMRSDSKVSRRKALEAGVAVPGILMWPQAALADSRAKYNGQYTDPLHPRCTRTVLVKGSDVTITGTDVKGGDVWKVSGNIVADSGLSIDFSPKGGPTAVSAEWTGDGFRFPDGNKWTKITEKDRLYATKIAGGYVDPKLVGSDIFVAVTKDGVTIKGSDGIGGRKWTLAGDVIGRDFYIDFTPLGGEKDTKVERTETPNGLSYPGGFWQSKGDGSRTGKI